MCKHWQKDIFQAVDCLRLSLEQVKAYEIALVPLCSKTRALFLDIMLRSDTEDQVWDHLSKIFAVVPSWDVSVEMKVSFLPRGWTLKHMEQELLSLMKMVELYGKYISHLHLKEIKAFDQQTVETLVAKLAGPNLHSFEISFEQDAPKISFASVARSFPNLTFSAFTEDCTGTKGLFFSCFNQPRSGRSQLNLSPNLLQRPIYPV